MCCLLYMYRTPSVADVNDKQDLEGGPPEATLGTLDWRCQKSKHKIKQSAELTVINISLLI